MFERTKINDTEAGVGPFKTVFKSFCVQYYKRSVMVNNHTSFALTGKLSTVRFTIVERSFDWPLVYLIVASRYEFYHRSRSRFYELSSLPFES